MTTVAPAALRKIYSLCRPHLTSLREGGIVGDLSHTKSGGYHISRQDLLRRGMRSDYSIQAPADKRGNEIYACGIDITLNLAEMIKVTSRLRRACTPDAAGEYDPRIEPMREFIGTIDGKNVCGYNRYATGSGTRSRVGWVASGFGSSSHLWHVHCSMFRDYAEDSNEMIGVAEVICGVPAGTFGWVDRVGEPTPPPPPPVVIPTYYVDPAKVTSFLWGVDHDTGIATKKREPGYEINTGMAIIEHEERKWLLTEVGYRYALDYLTQTKPTAPAPPVVLPKPVPTHTFKVLTINVLKENIDPRGMDWFADNRGDRCIAAIRSNRATLIGAQECRPPQRREIEEALGLASVYKGNVVLLYDPATWTATDSKGYDLFSGDDDRWLVAATFTHKPSGRTLRVGNTHLTNLEGPDGGDGWRVGQSKEILKYEPKLDLLFGDFNSYTVSLKTVKGVFGAAGLVDLWKRAPADKRTNPSKNTVHHFGITKNDGRRIDDVLTRNGVQVMSCGVLLLDSVAQFKNASDHNGVYAEIGVNATP